MVLKELIFSSLYFGRRVVVFLKGPDFVTVFNLWGRCGGLERTDFNSLYFGGGCGES